MSIATKEPALMSFFTSPAVRRLVRSIHRGAFITAMPIVGAVAIFAAHQHDLVKEAKEIFARGVPELRLALKADEEISYSAAKRAGMDKLIVKETSKTNIGNFDAINREDMADRLPISYD